MTPEQYQEIIRERGTIEQEREISSGIAILRELFGPIELTVTRTPILRRRRYHIAAPQRNVSAIAYDKKHAVKRLAEYIFENVQDPGTQEVPPLGETFRRKTRADFYHRVPYNWQNVDEDPGTVWFDDVLNFAFWLLLAVFVSLTVAKLTAGAR